MTRRRILCTLALGAAFALTACTASPAPTAAPTLSDTPGDGGQSAAGACAIIQESIDEATAAFSSASPDDPGSVVQALQSAAAELTEISAQVTNDEVAALLPPMRDMFARASEAMEAVAGGDVTRMGEVAEFSASFQEAAAAYQDVCATG